MLFSQILNLNYHVQPIMADEGKIDENLPLYRSSDSSVQPPFPSSLLDPSENKDKPSSFIQKHLSAPPGWFYQSPDPEPPVDPFASPTGSYFFYGTLMDPALLAEILDLTEKPVLRPAYIVGYSCKLWGQYAALIDGPVGAIGARRRYRGGSSL